MSGDDRPADRAPHPPASPFRTARDSYPDVPATHPRLGHGLSDLGQAQERIYAAVSSGLAAAADANDLHQLDYLVWSIGNRALEVADAFGATYRRWNLTAAAALVRLQVDNVLRLCLLRACSPYPPLEEALLNGEPLHRLRDPTREAPPGDDADSPKYRLTDSRLVELAGRDHRWIERVYEESSRWVHLSDRHHAVSYRTTDEGFAGSMPIRPEMYPVDLLVDVLWAAKASTEAIAGYCEWWSQEYRAHRAR